MLCISCFPPIGTVIYFVYYNYFVPKVFSARSKGPAESEEGGGLAFRSGSGHGLHLASVDPVRLSPSGSESCPLASAAFARASPAFSGCRCVSCSRGQTFAPPTGTPPEHEPTGQVDASRSLSYRCAHPDYACDVIRAHCMCSLAKFSWQHVRGSRRQTRKSLLPS